MNILNLGNKDIEGEIKASIDAVKIELKELVDQGTCQIYLSYIYGSLKMKHILSYIVDTTDLGYDFKHWFVVVPKDEKERYVIDLRYAQFYTEHPLFADIVNNGYQLMNEDAYAEYLNSISESVNYNRKNKMF